MDTANDSNGSNLQDSIMDRVRNADGLVNGRIAHENASLGKDVEAEVGRLLWLHVAIGLSESSAIESGNSFEAYQLFQHSIDHLTASLDLTKLHYRLQIGVLLRTAIETACTATHIVGDEEAFRQYERQEYESTRSVTFAKQVVPDIGFLWGVLSQYVVHVNRASHGSQVSDTDEGAASRRITVDLGQRTLDLKAEQKLLSLIGLTSAVVYFLQQDVFFEGSNLGEFFVKLRGGKFHKSISGQASIDRWIQRLTT